MKIQPSVPAAPDKSILLSQVASGDVFRFATDSFNEAIKTEAFYMRLEAPELKDGALIVNVKDGKRIVRDGIHRVIVHQTVIQIVP